MPNKPAALKALRQTRKRTVLRAKVQAELKRAVKTARRAVAAKATQSETLLKETTRLVDRAVKKHILTKNAAARTKSRLMKLWQKNSA